MIFLAFLVRGYGCSISHEIMPSLQGAKLGVFLVTHSLAYKNKELFKTVYDLYLFRINIYEGNKN